MTDDQARLLAVLEWLYDHIDDDRLGVKVADIDLDELAALGADVDRDGVVTLVRRGVAEAWLVEHANQADLTDPVPPVTLFIQGKRAVEAVREHRNQPVARAQAARRALLKYLYPLIHTDATDFEGSATATFYGSVFTEDEIRRAGEFLVSAGLVDGQTRADGLLWTGQLTASGTRCVEEYDGDLTAMRNAGVGPGVTHISNTQNIGVVSGTVNQGQEISSTNVSTSTTGFDAAQREAIFDQLRATLESLGNLGGEFGAWAREEAGDVAYALDELEQETSKDAPDEEKVLKHGKMLRRMSSKMAEGAATKVGGAVATADWVPCTGRCSSSCSCWGWARTRS